MKMNRENANRETIKALPIIRKGEETKTQDNATNDKYCAQIYSKALKS